MECGVCWHVYDPAIGDDVWQVETGVSFHDLPDHWRCPECDAEKSKFMPIGGDHKDTSREDDVARIVASYQRVDRDRMQDLPFRNAALQVEAVGFQNWGTQKLGIIISPWFINLVLIPGDNTDWSAHRHGDKVSYVLPAGHYEFVHGDLEDFGLIQTCSLMSPVNDIENQETARLIAEEVMRLMFVEGQDEDDKGTPLLGAVPDPEPETTPNVKDPISRRELLRGHRAKNAQEDEDT